MNNPIISAYKALAIAVIAITVVSMVPSSARASDFFDDLGRIIDPACLFACDNDSPKRVTKTVTTTNNYTNSNNVNSNINSPGAVVVDGNAYNQTPVYAYDYPSYPSYPQQNSPLMVSCYPMPLSAQEGDRVHWVASAYGGNGSYNYSWSGTNGLSGSGAEVTKRYTSSGYKNATIRVISGNQTKSQNCDASVYISGDYDDDYDYDYPHYPNYPQQYPLSVYCSVNTTFVQAGGTATWTAYASGGNGSYRYSWSGTDGLYGSGQSIYNRYYNTGTKYGTVTVHSDGQSVTRSCNNVLNVGVPVTGYNPYPQGNNLELDVACYADPVSPRINQPITWTVEVVGGQSPYTYSWSGTDGLSGTQSSVVKYYATTGEKSAIIAITSADGRSTTRACSHAVSVRGAASTVQPAPQAPVNTEDTSLSAASLFSLKNVPWGLVAILVILVLAGTVLYLLLNKSKM
ncbi:MAG: hypothetical protein AAB381_01790 [Patescibacteria group bacterium]